MSQSASTDYASLDRSPSKRPDFLLAIAGWPTLYSVADDTYAIASGVHDLSSTNGFTTIRKWADLPEISASKMKGAFPESGGFDIGDLKVELLDKHGVSTTTRDLSDLLGRQAYLEGNQTGAEYELADDPLTKAATTINLVSTSGIVAGDVLHISQEAILVGTVASGTQLTGCTRGYLLTNATRHEVGVKVYGYLPNLIGRPIWLHKGYRDLALSAWLECWGGLITNPTRSAPGKVSIQARATTWAMWGGSAPAGGGFGSPRQKQKRGANSPAAGVRRIVRLGAINDENNEENVLIYSVDGGLQGDFVVDFRVPLDSPSGLDDGHYLVNVDGYWFGICAPFNYEYGTAEGSFAQAVLVKGLGGGAAVVPDIPGGENSIGLDIGWTNATFSATAAAVGSDPIELMLQLLTSTGTATNGDYDDFKKGIGLGIPVEQIDLTSFTDIQAEYDYTTSTTRVFFVFTESADAKDFIEDELCKPFGWYLSTGNDGRIKLVRPKNPDKLYFSLANNSFTLTHSSSATERTFHLPGGVYTPTAAAAAVSAGLSQVTGQTITVTWSSSTGLCSFSVASGTVSFDPDGAWRTLGFDTEIIADNAFDADAAVAFWTADDFNTVTKDDVIAGSISVIPNGAARVGRVNFGCNYNWNEDRFDYKVFEDAEIENLSPFAEASPYEINSKGLLRAFRGNTRVRSPFGLLRPPADNGCTGSFVDVSSSYGIDESNSFATLFCSHLFDRYRNAPLRFKCRLKWKFNTREIGDVLSFTHDVDGALIDQERGTANVSARRFEIVGIRPVPASGCVEVELLGHRLGG